MWRLLALLLLAITARPSAAGSDKAAEVRPLGVEEVTAKGQYWGLALSPSGRYLAAVQNIEDASVVVVVDLDDSAAKPSALSVPKANIKSVDWVSDDRLVIAARVPIGYTWSLVRPDEVEKDAVMALRMFALDRDGGNATLLFKDDHEAVRSIELARIVAIPKDRRHVVVPAWQRGQLDLFNVDVYSGESRRIAAGNSNTVLWFADGDGRPAFRIDVHSSGRTARILAPRFPVRELGQHIEWEKLHTIRLRSDESDSAPVFYPIAFGPQINTYYVAARPGGANTTGVYLYDYVAKKYLKTLATDPVVDIENLLVDPVTRGYVGVTVYEDRRNCRMLDRKLQAHLDAIDRSFGNEVDVSLTDWDDARGTWLLYTEGPRDAGSWHVYRLEERQLHGIGEWLPALDRNRLGKTSVLRYKARDGLEIMGYLTVPPGYKPGDRPPLILMPHGGPEVRDTFGFDPWVQLLATRGYQVFRPNFRGSSGFGQRFVELGHGQWGAAMQDDLSDAVAFLVRDGRAAPDRTCIVGFSYGGYAALAGAALTPDLYRCAISYAGPAHLREQLKHDKRRFRGDDETWAYARRQIGDPDGDKATLDARSPALLADAVKAPILLVHGAEDGIVPIEQSELMEEALRKANKTVRFVKLEKVSHSPDREESRQVYTPMLEFLEQHLPVNPATAPPSAP